MRVTIKIDCDNAAFGDDPRPELARILRALADTADSHGAAELNGSVRDVNGNRVGAVEVEC